MASQATKMALSATVRAVSTRKSFISNRAAISLTPAAVSRIKVLMNERPDMIGLRVGVKQRGCNGLSYTLEYATGKEKLDEEVIQDGVRLLLDKKAQLTLLGTQMDFVESKLCSEFVFNNPNIKGTCGCGESFTI